MVKDEHDVFGRRAYIISASCPNPTLGSVCGQRIRR